MIRRIVTVLAAAAAFTVLLPGSGWGQPVPGTTTISTPAGLCLTALDGHITDGTPVVLAKCQQRPAQHWVVTPATGGTQAWHLYGTREYVTVLASADPPSLALGPAQFAMQADYVNHRIAADGDWLTWKPGDRLPFLKYAIGPRQTWYEFLTVSGGAA